MHISQLLLAQGIISADQLDKASSHLKSDSGRFTDQLVELGDDEPLVGKLAADLIERRGLLRRAERHSHSSAPFFHS